MSGRNMDSFLDDAEGFAALSEEEQARLIVGGTLEGDTTTDPEGEQPKGEETEISEAPAAESEATKEEQPAAEPVVLAKDGQHTIPFSELEAAREKARQLEQELLELKAGKEEGQPPETEQAPQGNEEILDLRRQLRDAMYAGDTDLADELDRKIDAAVLKAATNAAVQVIEARDAQKREQQTQDSIMADANARAAALVEQYPFLDPEGPATNQKAIDLVVLQRDKLIGEGMSFADAIEKAVGEIAPLFGEATTKQPTSDVAAKAAEAISKAKAKTPTSLSQVPAGAMAHHDEGEAIRSMDMNRLSRTLEGKTPDEIMKLMSKVL